MFKKVESQNRLVRDTKKWLEEIDTFEVAINGISEIYSIGVAVEEAERQFARSFGNMSGNAMTFVNEVSQLNGLSTAENMMVAVDIQSNYVGSGMEEEVATNMMGETLNLTSAISSYYIGETPESVFASFEQAFAGDMSGLIQYGINIDSAGLNLDKMSKAEQIQVIVAESYRQSESALNSFSSENLTTSQNVAILGASLENVFGNAVQILLPSLSGIIQSISDMLPLLAIGLEPFMVGLAIIFGIANIVMGAMARIAEVVASSWGIIGPVIWGVISALVVYNYTLLQKIALYKISLILAKKKVAMEKIQTIVTGVQNVVQQALNRTLAGSPVIMIAMVVGVIVGVMYKWIKSVGGLENAWLTVQNSILKGIVRIAKASIPLLKVFGIDTSFIDGLESRIALNEEKITTNKALDSTQQTYSTDGMDIPDTYIQDVEFDYVDGGMSGENFAGNIPNIQEGYGLGEYTQPIEKTDTLNYEIVGGNGYNEYMANKNNNQVSDVYNAYNVEDVKTAGANNAYTSNLSSQTYMSDETTNLFLESFSNMENIFNNIYEYISNIDFATVYSNLGEVISTYGDKVVDGFNQVIEVININNNDIYNDDVSRNVVGDVDGGTNKESTIYSYNTNNIDITLNNNIENESDIDVIIHELTEKLKENLASTPSGVYRFGGMYG